MLKSKKDNIEFSKSIISSGIVDSLLFIFETRDITLITIPVVQLFNQLTKVNDEINTLLFEQKNPYRYLFWVLQHSEKELDIIRFTINSIFNIILSGAVTTQPTEMHPHYESIKQCDGANKLFSFIELTDVYKQIKDSAVISFGNLYKAQEVPDEMAVVIPYLKSLLRSSDQWIRQQSRIALLRLGQNPVNRQKIETEDFKLPE
ncbi:MAG: hypothetical protein EZS28_037239 [Streblomastix strix]|uniref:Uncharacterized protein n=1 Tax=Streblomastix strix TaxID=222440 RepID=A0A5J4UCB1_9EUKA|nr:MAG: hypothetical protein EZS28_037239 [Streblomastix strix]